jgi:hypothetical protein
LRAAASWRPCSALRLLRVCRSTYSWLRISEGARRTVAAERGGSVVGGREHCQSASMLRTERHGGVWRPCSRNEVCIWSPSAVTSELSCSAVPTNSHGSSLNSLCRL